ncbi:MAG: hypothetical protein WBQ89_18270 [Candidatus Acidiferrum sp.]
MLKPKHLGLLGLLIVSGVLALILLIFFPSLPDPKCVGFLARTESDVVIPLPANCTQTTDVPPDDMVKYLENERSRRGLIFKKWITCKTPNQTPTPGFAFERDPRWLPSYVPRTYQFRRTVIILPYAQPVPEESSVVAEVCLMPWRRYVSQIAGQCDGKFTVWK